MHRSGYGLSVLLGTMLWITQGEGQLHREGYFRDVFMDAGVALTSRTTLPAVDSLGLTMEYMSTEYVGFQDEIILGNEDDSNGHLFYPDGSPRFRVIYTNGGHSSSHGASLGSAGRQRIRDFYQRGGGFTGTCAGAFITSLGSSPPDTNGNYYHIWPSWVFGTGLGGDGAYTGHFIIPDSPLLQYASFGGDLYIAGIYHWGGCYVNDQYPVVDGTEFLLRYDYPGWAMNLQPSCWAFKAADTTGRLVVIGSHPEGEAEGEGLELMESMLRYAMDGVPPPRIKGELDPGVPRTMDQYWEDDDPEFTRIGDRQIHHFVVEVPDSTSVLSLLLDGEEPYDFQLLACRDTLAFASTASDSSSGAGSDQVLQVLNPEPGTWHIGVKCLSTVQLVAQIYFGDLSILNGASYTVTAVFDTSTMGVVSQTPSVPGSLEILPAFPNPFNGGTRIRFHLSRAEWLQIRIFDLMGQEMVALPGPVAYPAGLHTVPWNGCGADGNPLPAGEYIVQFSSGQHVRTIKITRIP